MCCCCCYKMLWRAVNMSVVSDDDIFCEYQSVVLLLLCSLRRASLGMLWFSALSGHHVPSSQVFMYSSNNSICIHVFISMFDRAGVFVH